MKYTKTPIDYPEQIAILKDRGLLFLDEQKALEHLCIISYFRLASYLRPMEMDKSNHTFKPNSYFENAIDLYYFDKELRGLIFSLIQGFEIALRTKMIHHISMKYGAFWFMQRSLGADKKIFHDNFIHVQQEINRSKDDFIQEHFNVYDEPVCPPVWKTLEVVSFGTLSKLYYNFSDNKVKKVIAKDFNLPQHAILESWAKCVVVLRNCLAHHARVWNKRFPVKPQMPHKLSGDWIGTSSIDSSKLYSYLSCLLYLLNGIHPENDFKSNFRELLEKHPNVDTSAMGFPDNWEDEPLWK